MLLELDCCPYQPVPERGMQAGSPFFRLRATHQGCHPRMNTHFNWQVSPTGVARPAPGGVRLESSSSTQRNARIHTDRSSRIRQTTTGFGLYRVESARRLRYSTASSDTRTNFAFDTRTILRCQLDTQHLNERYLYFLLDKPCAFGVGWSRPTRTRTSPPAVQHTPDAISAATAACWVWPTWGYAVWLRS